MSDLQWVETDALNRCIMRFADYILKKEYARKDYFLNYQPYFMGLQHFQQ